uniref:Uncharacterized protein n=1 Tax=Pyropia pulchra TaxID=60925 RepID=O24673_9RHOD|nr:ORF6 [Pyropia pulchra]
MNDCLFYYKKNKHIYTKNVSLDNIEKNKNIYLPIVVDTEFVTRTFPYEGTYGGKDFTITVQVKGINSEEMIFLHPEVYDIARGSLLNQPNQLPLFETEFIILTILEN